jgi:hypothetical protein
LALLGTAPALRDYRLPNMTKRAILLGITGGMRETLACAFFAITENPRIISAHGAIF